MKTRESGMPEEELWASFFDAEAVLDRLGLKSITGNVVEFGCGYGTFTIPAARRTRGTIYAFDIEPEMIAYTSAKAASAGLNNFTPILRDFVVEGTGLAAESADYAMLFNILHAEHPLLLLMEARRILRPGSVLGIVHWNHDATTPRGPSMNIRPQPEQCRDWAREAGFELMPPGILDLPPYHYGMAVEKRPQ
jgi:SAM-dependent methyltransferase